jgi:hypothetical protein
MCSKVFGFGLLQCCGLWLHLLRCFEFKKINGRKNFICNLAYSSEAVHMYENKIYEFRVLASLRGTVYVGHTFLDYCKLFKEKKEFCGVYLVEPR